MPNEQNITLSARGLYTFQNKLSGSVPDGALTTASNVVIDRDGVITPRRGFQIYGTSLGESNTTAKQVIDYKYRILRHWSTTLDCDSDGEGDFTVLNDQTGNPAYVLEPVSGFRIRYVEANGNLYFTSSQGVRRISCLDITNIATTAVTQAGIPGALDSTAYLNPTAGWFTPDSAVAYRVVWGIKDENSNVLLGAPSQRVVISNSLLSSLVQDYNNLITALSIATNGSIPATLLSLDSSADVLYNALAALANNTPNTLDAYQNIQTNQVTTINVIPGPYYQTSGTSDYFTLYAAPSATVTTSQEYAIWFQSGTSTAPAVNGAKLLQIPINTSTFTGNTHTNTTIDGITSTANLTVGMPITGISLPPGTTISAIPSSTSITISASSSSSLTGITFTVGDTAIDVATKVAFVLSTTADFTATSSSNVITNTNTNYGLVAHSVSYVENTSSSGPNPTPFSVTTTTPGVNPTFSTIPITPSTPPDVPTPTGELQSIQSYFDAIITALNSASQFGGYVFSFSTEAITTNLISSIPQNITTAHFYQIFRSAIFTSGTNSTLADVVPDDELQLIYEGNPLAIDLTNRYFNFFDNVSDAVRAGGTYLYTNANSGNGIDQANTVPPLCRDISLYKVCTFFANTQSQFSTSLGLLSSIGLPGNSIAITQNNSTTTYTFVTAVQQITTINVLSGGNYVTSGTADYFDIYTNNNYYRIYFKLGTVTAPSSNGATLIPVTITSSYTADQVTLSLQNIINGFQDIYSTSSGNALTIVNTEPGAVTAPSSHVANSGFTIAVTTTGNGENASTHQIAAYEFPLVSTPAEGIDLTTRSLVRVINENGTSSVSAQYISGPNDLPGLFTLTTINPGDPIFYVTTNNYATGQLFNPSLSPVNTVTNITVANPTVVTSSSHNLVTGDSITIFGSNSTPAIDGPQIVTVIDANTFTVPVNVTIAGTTATWIITSSVATQDINPNRVYYSAVQQPDAVPIVNYFDVGPKNKNILRILALRNQLIILSEAGIYFLTGDDPTNFQLSLFDSSAWLKAPDSAVVLNNMVFAYTTQGIVTVSDSGTTVISRPIEDKLLPLLTEDYTSFPTATFAVNYDSDRSYLLFTLQVSTDTVATICYRFNFFTNTWTSWDVSKTCGVVDFEKDILYLGAADTNYIEVERKSFTRQDQADRDIVFNILDGSLIGTNLNVGSLFNTNGGDVLVQEQNLTITQFNRLITKLDNDFVLQLNYSDLAASYGVNLRDSLTSLAARLDTDPGLSIHTYSSDISSYGTSFIETQEAFNVIISNLNADPNIYSKTYITSSGTVEYEILVESVNPFSLQMTLSAPVPFIVGPVTRYAQIDIEVVWAPHHFGDPSMVKHVSESTVLFEYADFTEATLGYASDLSPGFDTIPVQGEGNGTWGTGTWGQGTWGGLDSSRPTRTYIPVNKQRCRFINGEFLHNNAFELFSIYGISYTFSPISNRAYR